MKYVSYILIIFTILLAATFASPSEVHASTATFPYNATGTTFANSSTADWTTTTNQAHNAITTLNTEWYYSVNLTGTAASIEINATTTANVEYSIDGDAFSPLTTNNWGTFTLFTGLTDIAHTVVIRRVSVNDPFYIDSDATWTVTGSAPALGYPTGYGPILSTQDSSIRAEGGFGTSIVPIALNSPWSDARLRFRRQISQINVFGWENGVKYRISVDGVLGPLTSVPNVSEYGWTTLATGLDATAPHDYEIIVAQPGANNSPTDIGAFNIYFSFGNDGGAQSAPLAYAHNLAAFGDSIAMGAAFASSPNEDATKSWVYLAATAKGWGTQNRGLGGSTVYNLNVASGVNRASNITGLSPAPDDVFVLYGTNDLNGYVNGGGTPTVSTLKSDYKSMVQQLTSGSPSSKFFFATILPREIDSTAYGLFNTAIQQVVSEVGASNAQFVDTTSWIDPTVSVDTWDGLHPNVTGAAKIANRVIPLISTTGYTVTGPSSGAALATSTSFTVSIVSGATFTGDQSITISDGGNGGTITPSFGSGGVSSVAVTPTNGATGFTFTYTPASTGPTTLTFGNTQGWIDPSVLNYSSNPVPAQPFIGSSGGIAPQAFGGSEAVYMPATAVRGTTVCAAAGKIFNIESTTDCTTNESATTTTPVVVTWVFQRTLAFGSRGNDVRLLQEYLNSHGALVSSLGAGSAGSETTMFGRATQAALARFQKDRRIVPAVGYFGALTRTYVNSHP